MLCMWNAPGRGAQDAPEALCSLLAALVHLSWEGGALDRAVRDQGEARQAPRLGLGSPW